MHRNYKIIEFVCLLSCISTGAFADTCKSGYHEVNIVAKEMDRDACFDSGFVRHDIPNPDYSDLYYIIPDAASGSRYAQGSCDADEYTIGLTMEMGQPGGKCASSFALLTLSSGRNISVSLDSTDGYAQGSCPNGYYDLTAMTGFSVETLDEGLCNSGYTQYYFTEERCHGSDTQSLVCPMLCEDGGIYTELGTCGTYCDAYDENLLHFGDKAARLWSTKQNVKNKSINIMSPSGTICYANLVAGQKSGTLNVKYENATYHVVDLVETGGNE